MIKSIISNNCWGGEVYKIYNGKYSSPTIGLYMNADDYIFFLKNFRYLITQEISFESAQNEFDFPIGYLGEVKIYFMHYRNKEEALDKWKRRLNRLPEDNDQILFEISDRDGFDERSIEAFSQLQFKNKIGFLKRGRYSSFGKSCFVEVECGGAPTCPDGVTLARMTVGQLEKFKFKFD
ncbi:DUF1919 domain-containing protein [Acetobacter senegalensis]|uniref:DUF1919 domain-containing protein n=1 Tax=Acetobacter senegalensis TaxID=446692 RepID=UPI001EDC2695|nr:DUF1919 domain-containing protein [Acetobacter senegalensis]MCG4271957.1 DUF1919 domain-containing protein [Acetobacter senegalensis]